MNYGIHSEFLNKTVCPFFCADTICDNLPPLRSLIRLIIKNNPLGKFVHWWVAKSPFSADWQIFGENGCRECGGRNRAGRISSKSCFVFSPFLGRICKLRPPLLRVKRKWSAWHMRKYDKQAKLIRSYVVHSMYATVFSWNGAAALLTLFHALHFQPVRHTGCFLATLVALHVTPVSK